MQPDDEINIEKWHDFEKSGKISDYLAYRACAAEAICSADGIVQTSPEKGMISSC